MKKHKKQKTSIFNGVRSYINRESHPDYPNDGWGCLYVPETFHYIIHLNERGLFYATVESDKNCEILSIKNEDDGSISLIEDGFIKNINDIIGIKDYLVQHDIIYKEDNVVFT
jgi:hypothetical protein